LQFVCIKVIIYLLCAYRKMLPMFGRELIEMPGPEAAISPAYPGGL
jgi:hypothetical protein